VAQQMKPEEIKEVKSLDTFPTEFRWVKVTNGRFRSFSIFSAKLHNLYCGRDEARVSFYVSVTFCWFSIESTAQLYRSPVRLWMSAV
jgi:hypothetical protein